MTEKWYLKEFDIYYKRVSDTRKFEVSIQYVYFELRTKSIVLCISPTHTPANNEVEVYNFEYGSNIRCLWRSPTVAAYLSDFTEDNIIYDREARSHVDGYYGNYHPNKYIEIYATEVFDDTRIPNTGFLLEDTYTKKEIETELPRIVKDIVLYGNTCSPATVMRAFKNAAAAAADDI